jgi:DNA invertase Pin-like site-specific DNA recombinase
LRERTMAGLASAKARGRKGGRPRSLSADKIALAQTMLASAAHEYTREGVAKQLGVGRTTLYRALMAAATADSGAANGRRDGTEAA